MNFIKSQWLAWIVILAWIVTSIYSSGERAKLTTETKELKTEIVNLQKLAKEKSKKIDSISRVDTVLVEKIKTIKIKGDAKIKSIDSLPISGLQQFFTDHYKK